jgi:predicted HicB family RNase H-like nuclease
MAEYLMGEQIVLLVALDSELYERLLVAANRDSMSVNDFAMLAIANYVGGLDGSLQSR